MLPIGYGDGYRRGLSNKAELLIGGRRFPVVGTISMDNITVDLGPDSGVRPGDAATLIGSDGDERVLAEEIAAHLGTINYEITLRHRTARAAPLPPGRRRSATAP